MGPMAVPLCNLRRSLPRSLLVHPNSQTFTASPCSTLISPHFSLAWHLDLHPLFLPHFLPPHLSLMPLLHWLLRRARILFWRSLSQPCSLPFTYWTGQSWLQPAVKEGLSPFKSWTVNISKQQRFRPCCHKFHMCSIPSVTSSLHKLGPITSYNKKNSYVYRRRLISVTLPAYSSKKYALLKYALKGSPNGRLLKHWREGLSVNSSYRFCHCKNWQQEAGRPQMICYASYWFSEEMAQVLRRKNHFWKLYGQQELDHCFYWQALCGPFRKHTCLCLYKWGGVRHQVLWELYTWQSQKFAGAWLHPWMEPWDLSLLCLCSEAFVSVSAKLRCINKKRANLFQSHLFEWQLISAMQRSSQFVSCQGGR